MALIYFISGALSALLFGALGKIIDLLENLYYISNVIESTTKKASYDMRKGFEDIKESE